MYIFNTLTVTPKMPKNIERLGEVSENLWWGWNTDFLKLFKMIDVDLWLRTNKNPVEFLKQVDQDKLERASEDEEFVKMYNTCVSNFDAYMNSKSTYFSKKYPDNKNDVIAYFSAEYGLDETVPLYSGGLGILSGDHLKSASDLGIPLVAVGLMYKEGYFTQKIDGYGNQISEYHRTDLSKLPIKPILDESGSEIRVSVNLEGNNVLLKLWKIKVGRVDLILVDADVDENDSKYRELSNRLYGGDRHTRIMQEIMLGIGGLRALDALGYSPKLYHMNEGHSAFLIFELISKIMKEKEISFEVSKEIVKTMTAFTTHTAVPAGIDIFDVELVKSMFPKMHDRMGISMDEFLSFGINDTDNHRQSFNMGVLALKFSGKRNGVSMLHGEVSRELFKETWPNTSESEVPIGHVTNGIHTATWLAPRMKELFNKHLKPFWLDEVYSNDVWKNIYNIPNSELADVHMVCKSKLIKEIKENIKERYIRNGDSYDEVNKTVSDISENDLLIGFARRFATYKRATIIFNDLDRLDQILNAPGKTVRLIFAGKAHPADEAGQDLIRRINEVAKMDRFKGKVILLENYNMAISRYLISGVDVWLNNPRRPYEASGTSGEKASVNGVINFSVLDGWWVEGYNGKNGWSIGMNDEYASEEEQDKIDSDSIYTTLETRIVPTYYDKDEDKKLSDAWIEIMKESIVTTGGEYSASRMLTDYLNDIYMPLIHLHNTYFKNFTDIFDFISWKKKAHELWGDIKISQEPVNQKKKIDAGEETEATVNVDFKSIDKENALVQAYVVELLDDGSLKHVQTIDMDEALENEDGSLKYEAKILLKTGGRYAYTYRVIPKHVMLINSEDMDLAKWFVKEN